MKINQACVANETRCAFGRVFRTGAGGDVFAYVPGETGCFGCLILASMKVGMDRIDDVIPLTDDEEHRVYGLGERGYRASGLSTDTAMITAIHARMALALLLDSPSTEYFPSTKANYILLQSTHRM